MGPFTHGASPGSPERSPAYPVKGKTWDCSGVSQRSKPSPSAVRCAPSASPRARTSARCVERISRPCARGQIVASAGPSGASEHDREHAGDRSTAHFAARESTGLALLVRRKLEHGDRNVETLDDSVQEPTLLPAGTISAAKRDQEVVGRELANRVVEGEQRVVGPTRPLASAPSSSRCPSTAWRRSSARSVAASVAETSQSRRPGNLGATTMISSAASISIRTPTGGRRCRRPPRLPLPVASLPSLADPNRWLPRRSGQLDAVVGAERAEQVQLPPTLEAWS